MVFFAKVYTRTSGVEISEKVRSAVWGQTERGRKQVRTFRLIGWYLGKV